MVPAPKKLTRRERKRLKWMRIKEAKEKNTSTKKYYGDWAHLADLVLEIVFQYLSLRVS